MREYHQVISIMKNQIISRLGAFLVDYLVILGYAGILFLIVRLFNLEITGPVSGQIIGFFGLTIPVFLYFSLAERSPAGATIGKKVFKLKVISQYSRNRVILRNLLKFLPWEIAHTGVHWIVYYSRQGTDAPAWVFVLLVVPQVIMLFYIASVVYSKGTGSVYDHIAGTRVMPHAVRGK